MSPGLPALREALAGAWHGPEAVLDALLAAVVAGGHVLLHDVPGVGKTTLAHALARALGGRFARIQGVADAMPSDWTGGLVLGPDGRPTFQPGPIFAHVVLVDEIHRAPPRAQSALLEAMAEGQATIDGTTHALPSPHLVIATENPWDGAGSWPLPEAQLDRFLLRLQLGYPSRAAARSILVQAGGRARLPEPVLDVAGWQQLRAGVEAVQVRADLVEWLLDVVDATRTDARLVHGLSPRAAQAWHRAARGLACVHGRDHVLPDDLLAIAPAVLLHRLSATDPTLDVAAHLARHLAARPLPR